MYIHMCRTAIATLNFMTKNDNIDPPEVQCSVSYRVSRNGPRGAFRGRQIREPPGVDLMKPFRP
jgi:hypothetical protein